MPQIGPQLPPHLLSPSAGAGPPSTASTKRKRTPEDDNGHDGDASSRSAKSLCPSAGPAAPPGGPENADTITLGKGGSDEEGFGPRIRPTPAAGRPSNCIGPALPSDKDEISLGDDEDADRNDVGPRPAPAPAPAAPKRRIGPAPPPADLAARPSTGPDSDPDSDSDDDDDDDDDDDFMPPLPAHGASPSVAANIGPSLPPFYDDTDAPSQRDSWMLAPPRASSASSRAPDPTKLRARKFATGRAAQASAARPGDGEIDSIWTETAVEKRQRLEDAVLGRSRDGRDGGATRKTSNAGGGSRRDGDEVTRERIQDFTSQTRGARSLYQEHQEGKKKKDGAGENDGGDDDDDDDPSKRAFDRDKDMRVGGRISATQRRDLLNRAAGFGGRFSKGTYL